MHPTGLSPGRWALQGSPSHGGMYGSTLTVTEWRGTGDGKGRRYWRGSRREDGQLGGGRSWLGWIPVPRLHEAGYTCYSRIA